MESQVQMIDGDKKIEELIANVFDPIFNDWEKSFIKELQRVPKPYMKLSKSEKAVVIRLWEWLKGK